MSHDPVPYQPTPPAAKRAPTAMMRRLGRLAAAGLVLLALTYVGLAGFALLFPALHEMPDEAPLAVVLGGGLEGDGALSPLSRGRIETGLALLAEGRVPRLHLTGSAGEVARMTEIARHHGAPPDVLTFEDRSSSTLQNARFTLEAIGPLPAGTLLVTQAYHLPRAWASFRWAGARGLVLVPAQGFSGIPLGERAEHLGRETLAWWFNIGRTGVVGMLEAFGLGEDATDPLLAEIRP
jgi:uncharacterized SAM-binding protein YcdF (DUF218 family)